MSSLPSSTDPTSLTKNLNLITGGISILACLWLFHFYSKTPQPRPISLKLILLLSVADFGYSIANILSVFDTDIPDLCDLEAMIRIFSMTSGLYWSTCMAILTYESFSKGKQFQQDSFFRKTLVIGSILPLLYSVFPFFTDKYTYGPKKFGCYVIVNAPLTEVPELDDLILILIVDGIPVVTALTLTLTFYALVVKKVSEISDLLAVNSSIEIKRLFWYPAAIFLAYIPSFIDNVIQIYITSSVAAVVFITLHILFTHSVGLTNTLIYGLQRKKYYDTYEKPEAETNTSQVQMNENKVELEKSVEYDLNGSLSFGQSRRSSCDEDLIQARSDNGVYL